jgi:hypothetical protein
MPPSDAGSHPVASRSAPEVRPSVLAQIYGVLVAAARRAAEDGSPADPAAPPPTRAAKGSPREGYHGRG